MAETLGRHHPTVRRIRALRRDGARRRHEGVFLAEGVHLAFRALDHPGEIELVVGSPRLSESDEGRRLSEAIRNKHLSYVETTNAVMETLQDARSPQPITMIIRRATPPPDAGLACANPLVLVAHGVQDPGNLGSLVRTADAAGASAVRVAGSSADAFHPRAVRATMGSIFRVPVIVQPSSLTIATLKERKLRLVGTHPTAGIDYHRCDLRRPSAIFVGGEGAGLPPAVRAEFDDTVRVPMRRGVESLSVGAAAAVVLFEAARQRGELSEIDQPFDL